LTNEQIALTKAQASRAKDVRDLFKRAVSIFGKVSPEQQSEIAKATALELGGLTVDQSDKIKVGAA
jgi:hypothetical protein